MSSQPAPAAAPVSWHARRVGGIAVTASAPRPGLANVALFHGALGDSERIAPIAPHLADCNLAFLDMRGHGRSHRPAHGYAIDELAAELVAPLAASFETAPFAILAESFSAVIALAIAPLMPNLRALVLVDPPFDTTRMQASHAALMRAHARATPAERPALEALCRAFFGLDVRSGAVVPLRFHRHLAACRVPVTIVTGTRKASAEPNAPEPAAYFEAGDLALLEGMPESPRVDVVEIPDAGHRLLKTHLREVVTALRGALTRLPAS
jgi:pimeloyl-ACP methyl ester carboxylesterase